jgi:hypothetical protein
MCADFQTLIPPPQIPKECGRWYWMAERTEAVTFLLLFFFFLPSYEFHLDTAW